MSINTRRRPYRRPAVNYIPDRINYEETYEQMLAKSCKWCSIKMVYRKDIDSLFCCYCGWQPEKASLNQKKRVEPKVKADKQEGDVFDLWDQ